MLLLRFLLSSNVLLAHATIYIINLANNTFDCVKQY